METKNNRRAPQHIPDDIFFNNILKRLPSKSLARFKCVCKPWRSFISQLRNQKLILSSQSSIFSVDFEGSKIEAVQLNFPLVGVIKVIGSCNGLLCVAVEKTGFVIWNPWTRRYKKVLRMSLDFSREQYGFGYDKSRNSCVIVRFLDYMCSSSGIEVDIYSLKTYSESNSWQNRKLEDRIYSIDLSNSGRTSANGFQFWLIKCLTGIEYNFQNAVLSFDFTNRKFSVIFLPEDVARLKKPALNLNAIDERQLCMFHHRNQGHIDLWEWKDDGENRNWNKLLSIPSMEIWLPMVPLCIMKNGKVLFGFKPSEYEVGKGYFILYNLEENKFESFKIQGVRPSWVQGTIHTESLVSDSSWDETGTVSRGRAC